MTPTEEQLERVGKELYELELFVVNLAINPEDYSHSLLTQKMGEIQTEEELTSENEGYDKQLNSLREGYKSKVRLLKKATTGDRAAEEGQLEEDLRTIKVQAGDIVQKRGVNQTRLDIMGRASEEASAAMAVEPIWRRRR